MTHNELIDMIDLYLRDKLSEKERSRFVEAIKNDVDKMVELEISRAATVKMRNGEKAELINRFKKEYGAKNEAPLIPMYNEKRDNKILEFMNAAFAKNINLLEHYDSVVDWETILEFLEGDDED